jgi:hypothetical protein
MKSSARFTSRGATIRLRPCRASDGVTALPLARPTLFAVAIAAGVAFLILTNAMSADEATPDPHCEVWDETASAALAAAIAERSPILEHQIGDAVFGLRRARRNCRAGWHALARLDYEALIDGRYAGVRTPLVVNPPISRH